MNTTDIVTAVEKIADVAGEYDIRLGSLRSSIHRFGPTHIPQRVRFAHRAEIIPSEDKNVLLVMPSFLVELAENDESFSPQPVAFIAASYVIGIRLKEGEVFTPDEQLAFSLVNGVFILWPYWRELVQNTLLRMGLQSVPVPPMDTVRLVADAETIMAEMKKIQQNQTLSES